MFALCIFLSAVVTIQAQMEGFIVGGTYASIIDYPYSAHISISCFSKENKKGYWLCGSSILNQNILITAGHCLHMCISGTYIVANMGSDHRERGVKRTATEFVLHEKFRHVYFDIALVKLTQPLMFNSSISRVAIMRSPPYYEPAKLAGWGRIDPEGHVSQAFLKQIDQKVWNHEESQKECVTLHEGVICASSNDLQNYANFGDSGSPLVVRGYIQVGLKSHKSPKTGKAAEYYTDVGYFYDWITNHSRVLYCQSDEVYNVSFGTSPSFN